MQHALEEKQMPSNFFTHWREKTVAGCPLSEIFKGQMTVNPDSESCLTTIPVQGMKMGWHRTELWLSQGGVQILLLLGVHLSLPDDIILGMRPHPGVRKDKCGMANCKRLDCKCLKSKLRLREFAKVGIWVPSTSSDTLKLLWNFFTLQNMNTNVSCIIFSCSNIHAAQLCCCKASWKGGSSAGFLTT